MLPTELGLLVRLEHLWLGGNRFVSVAAAGGIESATPPTFLNTPSTTADEDDGAGCGGGGGGGSGGGNADADADAIPVAAIPTQLGLLSRLQTLQLMGNQLRGVIPSELGNLVACTSIVVIAAALLLSSNNHAHATTVQY